MEQVGGGHCKQAFVYELPAKGCSRLRRGRFQEPPVAEASRTSVADELEGVQLEHILEVEEFR